MNNFNYMDQEQSEDFITEINNNIEMSFFLLNNHKPMILDNYPVSSVLDALKTYQKFISFVEQLGWIEHTCDWDLFIRVQLNNGDTWQSEHGYHSYEVNNNIVYFQTCDKDDIAIYYPIAISDIKSLQLKR